ncbi:hypothetical protein [Vibrio sp. WXL210]|uniref:hypothetical protein n=1 Tax=Vibrio sp. WXL210 TaxID=3450709 RepID=UPI003EC72179
MELNMQIIWTQAKQKVKTVLTSSIQAVAILCLGYFTLKITAPILNWALGNLPVAMGYSATLLLVGFLTFHATYIIYEPNQYLSKKVWSFWGLHRQLASRLTVGIFALMSLAFQFVWELKLDHFEVLPDFSGELSTFTIITRMTIAGFTLLCLLFLVDSFFRFWLHKTIGDNYDFHQPTDYQKFHRGFTVFGSILLTVPLVEDGSWFISPMVVLILMIPLAIDITRNFIKILTELETVNSCNWLA